MKADSANSLREVPKPLYRNPTQQIRLVDLFLDERIKPYLDMTLEDILLAGANEKREGLCLDVNPPVVTDWGGATVLSFLDIEEIVFQILAWVSLLPINGTPGHFFAHKQRHETRCHRRCSGRLIPIDTRALLIR